MSFDHAKKHLDEMKELLLGCMDKRERLETLIEVGKELDELSKEQRTDDHKVPGCVSNVFIIAEQKDGFIVFNGSSDALIVKGYVKILTEALSGLTLDEIMGDLEPIIQEFIHETGISESLVATRANAFASIFRFMQKKAQAVSQ